MRHIHKHLFAAAALFVTCNTAWAVAGDSPCTATVFEACTAIGSITYTMSSSANWTAAANGISDPVGTCLNTGSKDVNYWFSYTATQDDNSILINVGKPGGGGSISECGVQVYSASSCSSTFTLITCQNNASDDNANTASISVTAGTVYYVRVFEATGNASGNIFTASITVIKNTSIGQTACNARVISSLPYTYSSNTLCNGNTIAANCAGKTAGTSGSGEDYFFKYTSAGNEYISVNLSGLNPAITQGLVISNPVSNCSTAKTCYTSTTANGTFPGGIAGVAGTSSSLCRTVYLSSAGDYYLIMDASSARGGPFTLSVSSYTPSSTADACSWAQGITPTSATYSIDNCSSTADHDPVEPNNPISAAAGPSGCGYSSENSKWFTFVAETPAPAQIVVSASGVSCTNPDYANTAGIEMGIFTGTCGGTFTKVGSCISSSSATISQTISSPPAGQQYYVVVDGTAGSICSFTISASNVVPLPVSMLSFDVMYDGSAVNIDWHTASEVNNDYFSVERSYDAQAFETIAIMAGQGSETQEGIYHVTDRTMQDGIVYYRLKQTDVDGRSSYSIVRAVDVRRDAPMSVTVLQGDASPRLVVTGLEGDGLVTVTDAMGRTVFQGMLSGNHHEALPVSDTPGIYWVIVSAGERVARTKFVNQ